ncbi:MAG: MFS transporter [Pseudomonadota bacterium]
MAEPISVSSNRVIAGSIAVGIAFVMELTLVPLLLPAIQAQFGLSISQLAWVFNSYGVSVALGVLIGGWLGDAFDTRLIFRIGVLLFAIGAVIVAYAGGFETIVAGRIIQGFGGGIFLPLIPLLLTRAAPHRPGKVLIIWGSIAGYVAAFAPYLYGSTLAVYGWHLGFVIFALVALVALAIVNGSGGGARPPKMGDRQFSYRVLLSSRELWVMFVYVFCTYGSITYYLFRLPLWLAENNIQVSGIGFALSSMWLSFSVVSTLLRNKVDAPHIRGILIVAPFLIAAGFPLAYFGSNSGWLILSSILVGAGLACSNAPSTQLILKFAPNGMSAAAASFDITFARLGGVATVALLAESAFGYAVISISVLSCAALLCALLAVKNLNAALAREVAA